VRVLLRLSLVLICLSWLVLPGMGLIDLSVTWDEDWPVMLEAGWGLFCTIGLGLPALVAALRPRASRAASLQLSVATAALAAGAIGGHEPQAWWFFPIIGVQALLLRAIATEPGVHTGRSAPLLVLAAASAPGWLIYAWWCLEQNRRSLLDSDITNDVDHYAVQGALAVALVALPVVAGLVSAGRRLLGTSTAVMAGYLGLLSLSWPDAVAGFDPAWSVLVMVWAGSVLVASWWRSAMAQPGSTLPQRAEQVA
jgi:hypothetical protein